MKFTKTARQRFRDLDFTLHRARLSMRGDGFSNENEEQILARYIATLLPADHDRTAVDIGAGDGVRWSNTYGLFLSGWQGLGIELDSRKFVKLAQAYKHFSRVFACRNRATPENIVSLLQSYQLGTNFSLLSLDIDGNDYWVLRAILSEYRPQLIVTEINEKIPPPFRFVVKYDPDFQLRHHFFGYSISMLEDLCEEFGYAILELEYNNAFIVPKELAKEQGVSATASYSVGYLERPDRKEKFALNFDMEAIYTMTENEAFEFLKEFYNSRFAGEFHLELSRESMASSLGADSAYE